MSPPSAPPPRPRDLGHWFPGAVTITHLLPGACGALGCARVTSVCRCTRSPGCVPAACGGMGGCPPLACWAGRGGAGRMLPAGHGLCRAVGETDRVCSHSGQARVTVLGRVSAARELSSRHCCRLACCGITLWAWAVDTEGARRLGRLSCRGGRIPAKALPAGRSALGARPCCKRGFPGPPVPAPAGPGPRSESPASQHLSSRSWKGPEHH